MMMSHENQPVFPSSSDASTHFHIETPSCPRIFEWKSFHVPFGFRPSPFRLAVGDPGSRL